MWGLNPEEIDRIWQDYRRFDGLGLGKEIVQATLRHVYEEGEKPCPHIDEELIAAEEASTSLAVQARIAARKRFGCSLCLAELAKEAGL